MSNQIIVYNSKIVFQFSIIEIHLAIEMLEHTICTIGTIEFDYEKCIEISKNFRIIHFLNYYLLIFCELYGNLCYYFDIPAMSVIYEIFCHILCIDSFLKISESIVKKSQI